MILACRDVSRARVAADDIRQKSGNGNVVVKKVDLASLQSVRELAKDVQETEQRLDVLINNAGVSLNPANTGLGETVVDFSMELFVCYRCDDVS